MSICRSQTMDIQIPSGEKQEGKFLQTIDPKDAET